jgi:hypothetical protein
MLDSHLSQNVPVYDATIPSQQYHAVCTYCKDNGFNKHIVVYMCDRLRREHKPARGMMTHLVSTNMNEFER